MQNLVFISSTFAEESTHISTNETNSSLVKKTYGKKMVIGQSNFSVGLCLKDIYYTQTPIL